MSKDKNKNIELAEAKAQISGELINQTNSKRQKMLQGAVRKIDDDHLIKSEQREACFMEALSAMDQAKEFCNNPNNVLGSTKTKHGEVAERIEEALLNAEASFNGEEPIATASPDIVGRTINAPADIMINGIPVQLKYCKTELASIYNVNKHLKKYPDFGSKDGAYYIIPKDQYELISAMYNKTIDELTNHEKTVLNWVYKIENQTNRKFGDIIRSGKTTYAEVQLDIANDTINSKINTLDKEKKDQLKELEREKNANKKNAEKKYASSAKEAIKVAGISAVMGAGMTLALILFQKWDEGTSTALFKWLHFLLMSPRLPFQRDQYHPGSISNDILLVPD